MYTHFLYKIQSQGLPRFLGQSVYQMLVCEAGFPVLTAESDGVLHSCSPVVFLVWSVLD